MTKPENAHETSQVRDVTRDLNRARCTTAALTFALMFERLIISNTTLNGDILFESEGELSLDSRPMIEWQSPELESCLSIENPGLEYMVPDRSNADLLKDIRAIPLMKGIWAGDEEQASLLSLAEPLLWHRLKASSMSREVLRDVIDTIAIDPSVLSLSRWQDPGEELPERYLRPLSEKYGWSEAYRQYFRAAISIVRLKGDVALGELRSSVKNSAVMAVPGMTFAKTTSLPAYLSVAKPDKLTAGVRLFLDEVEFWPDVSDLGDVFRLRESRNIKDFRDVLSQWVDAIEAGDAQREARLRREIRSANRALKNVATCARIGRIATYVSIPLMALDDLWMPLFGPALTVAGVAMQIYADRLLGDHKWIAVCTP